MPPVAVLTLRRKAPFSLSSISLPSRFGLVRLGFLGLLFRLRFLRADDSVLRRVFPLERAVLLGSHAVGHHVLALLGPIELALRLVVGHLHALLLGGHGGVLHGKLAL